MDNKHRYVIIGDGLWRLTRENYRKALEKARATNSTKVEVDTDQFRMVQVDEKPADWSNLTSAEAEALLLGMGSETADQVEQEQTQQAAS